MLLYTWAMKKTSQPLGSGHDRGNSTSKESQPLKEKFPFPVVGIGASAGVVITFSDITAAKQLETELRNEIARLKGLLENGD